MSPGPMSQTRARATDDRSTRPSTIWDNTRSTDRSAATASATAWRLSAFAGALYNECSLSSSDNSFAWRDLVLTTSATNSWQEIAANDLGAVLRPGPQTAKQCSDIHAVTHTQHSGESL
jgi:hypothetical protein